MVLQGLRAEFFSALPGRWQVLNLGLPYSKALPLNDNFVHFGRGFWRWLRWQWQQRWPGLARKLQSSMSIQWTEHTECLLVYFILFSCFIKHAGKWSLNDYPKNQQASIAWQQEYFSAGWLKFYYIPRGFLKWLLKAANSLLQLSHYFQVWFPLWFPLS